MDRLCDDILLLIFARMDLRTRMITGAVCRRWRRLARRSWRFLQTVTLHTLFKERKLPKGKYLNKALSYVLSRCGRNLRSLDLTDPEPEFRFVKANEATFRLIGHYCHNLEEINFTDMLLLNDMLKALATDVNCSKLRRVNLNSAFNHFCAIHDGLSSLYNACPCIEYLNISNSLNARVRDCRELWPTTLTEVYVDHAWAITSYTLLSLVNCCPQLQVFSMCGNQSGMDSGLEWVFSRLHNLHVLYVKDYPGDAELGVQLGRLSNLRELHLGGSSMVTDRVIDVVARNCPQLLVLDCGVFAGQSENDRYGALTDVGLSSVARFLPGLRRLHLDRRVQITDSALIEVIANRSLAILTLAGNDGVTDLSLECLARHGVRLVECRLAQLINVRSQSIVNLCKMWFINGQTSRFDLHLDDVSLDFAEFMSFFRPISGGICHEFTIDHQRNSRKLLRLRCDMMLTMYA